MSWLRGTDGAQVLDANTGEWADNDTGLVEQGG